MTAPSLQWKALKEVKAILDRAKLDIYSLSYEKDAEKRRKSLEQGLERMTEASDWLLYIIDDIDKK